MPKPRANTIVAVAVALLSGCALSGRKAAPAPLEPLAAPLVMDDTEVGMVTVVEELGALVIDARTDAPWSIESARIYAGPGEMPAHSGDERAEAFPYAIDFDQPVTDYSLELPFAAVGAACGQPMTTAVRLSVISQTSDGSQPKTVWARLNGAGPELVVVPKCAPEPVAMGDGSVPEGDEVLYEEISDELVDEADARESVAGR